MAPESRNNGARVRRPLMSNNLVNNKFPLQRLAGTRFRVNEYSGMNRGVARRLSRVFMAKKNNREQLTALFCDLYSIRMKLVQSEIQRS
jgi:hypothetical protein